MARLEQITVSLNSLQIAILPVLAEILEDRAREPCNHKTITVNANVISKRLGADYNAVKKNLLKFKELKK